MLPSRPSQLAAVDVNGSHTGGGLPSTLHDPGATSLKLSQALSRLGVQVTAPLPAPLLQRMLDIVASHSDPSCVAGALSDPTTTTTTTAATAPTVALEPVARPPSVSRAMDDGTLATADALFASSGHVLPAGAGAGAGGGGSGGGSGSGGGGGGGGGIRPAPGMDGPAGASGGGVLASGAQASAPVNRASWTGRGRGGRGRRLVFSQVHDSTTVTSTVSPPSAALVPAPAATTAPLKAVVPPVGTSSTQGGIGAQSLPADATLSAIPSGEDEGDGGGVRAGDGDGDGVGAGVGGSSDDGGGMPPSASTHSNFPGMRRLKPAQLGSAGNGGLGAPQGGAGIQPTPTAPPQPDVNLTVVGVSVGMSEAAGGTRAWQAKQCVCVCVCVCVIGSLATSNVFALSPLSDIDQQW